MKKKKEYPLNGKNLFGLSTMGWMNTGATSFMTSMFMLYLTDYSGIGAMAAALGTVLLLIGRIVDAVDDPLQGWIMDNTKPGKYADVDHVCGYQCQGKTDGLSQSVRYAGVHSLCFCASDYCWSE